MAIAIKTATPQPMEGGMTLRDWFAAHVLVGMDQKLTDDMDYWYREPREIAARCYAIADAMLAERAK